MRLPKVIVPVLSSSSVSTSPAASTARPDLAMTLARTSRSMPAMPMAESSPPMVVGISVTNSATRKTTGIVAPAKRAKGSSVTTTKRKISVKPDEQDVERDLVRGLLPLGALDQRDHAVEEALARLGGDPDDEPVRDEPGAAGDGRAVAAGFADHRRGLAGDGALVDRGDALDDLAVGRDDVAGLDEDDVAAAELRGRHRLEGVVRRVGGRQLLAGGLGLGGAQARRLRLAAALGDRLGEVREEHGQPEPDRDLQDQARARRAGAERGRATRSRSSAAPPRRSRRSPGSAPGRAGRAWRRRWRAASVKSAAV